METNIDEIVKGLVEVLPLGTTHMESGLKGYGLAPRPMILNWSALPTQLTVWRGLLHFFYQGILVPALSTRN